MRRSVSSPCARPAARGPGSPPMPPDQSRAEQRSGDIPEITVLEPGQTAWGAETLAGGRALAGERAVASGRQVLLAVMTSQRCPSGSRK
jgi:hypothetical protein